MEGSIKFGKKGHVLSRRVSTYNRMIGEGSVTIDDNVTFIGKRIKYNLSVIELLALIGFIILGNLFLGILGLIILHFLVEKFTPREEYSFSIPKSDILETSIKKKHATIHFNTHTKDKVKKYAIHFMTDDQKILDEISKL